MRVDHVSAHVGDHGVRLLAERAGGFARVFLHVLGEVAAVGVGGAADRTAVGAASCNENAVRAGEEVSGRREVP